MVSPDMCNSLIIIIILILIHRSHIATRTLIRTHGPPRATAATTTTAAAVATALLRASYGAHRPAQ